MTQRTTRRIASRSGFTLTELLVTIAIFGVLLGAALPHVDTRRQDVNNVIKQVVADLRWARARSITSGVHFALRWTGPSTYRVERFAETEEGDWELDEVVKAVQIPSHIAIEGWELELVRFNTRGLRVLPEPSPVAWELVRVSDAKFGAQHGISIWPSGQIYEEF